MKFVKPDSRGGRRIFQLENFSFLWFFFKFLSLFLGLFYFVLLFICLFIILSIVFAKLLFQLILLYETNLNKKKNGKIKTKSFKTDAKQNEKKNTNN